MLAALELLRLPSNIAVWALLTGGGAEVERAHEESCNIVGALARCVAGASTAHRNLVSGFACLKYTSRISSAPVCQRHSGGVATEEVAAPT